jgi:hypothetical protein
MMNPRLLFAVSAVLLAVACSPIAGGSVEPEDYYLKGRARGPYTGRVIDAETRQPLEGAVVVAVWWRHRLGLGHSVSSRYAAREVLTDREGRFMIDAKALEERAPYKTLPPTFTIFVPGYAAFTSDWTTVYAYFKRDGFDEGTFGNGRPVTVGLPRLTTWEERLGHIGELSPYRLSSMPFREIPEFTNRFNQERVAVGLGPYPPPGKRTR